VENHVLQAVPRLLMDAAGSGVFSGDTDRNNSRDSVLNGEVLSQRLLYLPKRVPRFHKPGLKKNSIHSDISVSITVVKLTNKSESTRQLLWLWLAVHGDSAPSTCCG
jgi:hypothetical protein